MANKLKPKWVWLEEYKNCSCSFIAVKKLELPGYCPRHATNRKYRTRIHDEGFELGYVGQ